MDDEVNMHINLTVLICGMKEIKKQTLVKIISQVINSIENIKHNKTTLAHTKIPFNTCELKSLMCGNKCSISKSMMSPPNITNWYMEIITVDFAVKTEKLMGLLVVTILPNIIEDHLDKLKDNMILKSTKLRKYLIDLSKIYLSMVLIDLLLIILNSEIASIHSLF